MSEMKVVETLSQITVKHYIIVERSGFALERTLRRVKRSLIPTSARKM